MRLPAFLTTLAVYLGLIDLDAPQANARRRSLARNDAAEAGFGHIVGVALTVAAIIIGAVVAIIILATLFPTYSGAVGNLSTNFTNANWGNSTANSLSPVFGLLIALLGMFAIIGLAFLAFQFKGSLIGKSK